MTGLASARFDQALAADATAKGAPEWVHLVPSGFIKGRDGRTFDLADPAGLILAFQAGGIDLPVDYEHQNDNPDARLKGPVPAAGWIKELQSRADGIWGRIEWTATAAEMIGAKEYRFISPSILYSPTTREIMRIIGAGLVHQPNFHLTALASQETAMPANPSDATPTLNGLLATLGLTADASAKDILAVVTGLLRGKLDGASTATLAQAMPDFVPDPAKYMPMTAVQELLRDRKKELSLQSEDRVNAKVDGALRDYYITPGMKDWALSLCRSDEAAFDTFCKQSGPTFSYLFKETHTARLPENMHELQPTPLETAICEQLGLKPGSLRD